MGGLERPEVGTERRWSYDIVTGGSDGPLASHNLVNVGLMTGKREPARSWRGLIRAGLRLHGGHDGAKRSGPELGGTARSGAGRGQGELSRGWARRGLVGLGRSAFLLLLAVTTVALATGVARSRTRQLGSRLSGLANRAGGLARERAGQLRRPGRSARGAGLSRAAGLLRHPGAALSETLRQGPPRPFRSDMFRSPLRGPWLTSLLGLVLLGGLTIMAITGLLSYASYNPRLPGNDQTPGAHLLKFYLFGWPTGPDWLYRVNQGVHVTLGLALLPIVLAKLWSVLPRLFAWPPVRSVAQILERLSLIMVVGGVLFETVTGILNIQNYYVFPFSFYTAHLYGAWVFIAGLVVHVLLKFGKMRAGLRSRSLRAELRIPLAQTRPEGAAPEGAAPGDPEPDSLRPVDPARPTISRRGLLAAVAGASLTLAGLAVGQSIGGWARWTALFGPRGTSAAQSGVLPVNRTAAVIGLTDADVGPAYRLVLAGRRQVSLTREQVAALPQRSAELPIACVEGWSAAALWSGVRLTELARLAGVPNPAGALVESIERAGSFRQASLSAAQVTDPRSMLALRVNGADLSRDHGYPARTIIPAAPGVHNTKWVNKITFLEAA
jgi:DMSO/TMAO reductase YedYZ molybdopterin-dependent catalytic subunit